MKRLLSVLLPLTFSAMANATGPGVKISPVDHLYIPTGFDNNDNVEILVSGKFPNTCYSRNKVEVTVKEAKININITALVKADKSLCEEMEISYLENVTVGSLQAGQYQVTVNEVLNDSIMIAEANSSSVDDHLYAMVDYVDLGFTGGLTGDAFLVGRSPDCVELDRVETISNKKDTYSILPIMKKVSQNCSQQKTHFTIPIRFDPRLSSQDKILLFVKTMDGKSVHALIEK